MPANGEKVEQRAVTLYPSDWATVEAADNADAGVSATLRRIIREWQEYQEQDRILTEHLRQHKAAAREAWQRGAV